ncbi:unnamed protein product [Chironomus riparius]|uniref:Uncharacterized protein n=1 Tax=Chironomus riparius TaxID=315576 RepID=A0A9N9S2G9_9DIPT|nr:unnamed protein product [Chironomus riparius]
MSRPKSTEEIEYFLNDKLKVELGNLENALNKSNEDVMEYIQLEKTIEFIKTNKSDGFKTQIDVGTNMFMEASVDKIEPILINVGLNVYLELSIEEALKFLGQKIKILNKESEVIREESLKVRAEIKILLMYLAERKGFAPSEIV